MTAANNPLDLWIAAKLGLGQRPLTRAALTDWQLGCLQETLTWTRARSSFYQQHLSMLGNRKLSSLTDLAYLPFTTADDITADPLRFVCVSQGDIDRVVTLDTSGTTGMPKRLFFTAADQEITLDFFDHGLRLMAKAGDTVLILLPGDKPSSVGDLLRQAVRRLGGTPIVAGTPHDVAATAALAMEKAAALIIGIPVQVLALARHFREKDLTAASVAKVLLCSDNVPDTICQEISSIWNCEVFQDWGMTELGYGGGVDCSAHCGYHLQEGDFLFEVVDARTGGPLPSGEIGEIVITTLTRRGMPLIRYRTGDLSRFIDQPCSCGSVLRRLDRIETRKTGLVRLASGEISMASLDAVLFREKEVEDFTASLIKASPSSVLKIKIHPAASASAHATALCRSLQQAVTGIAAIHAACESGLLTVDIELTGEAIPFTRQKRALKLEPAP
ncbi:DVU_1553 family AMP-dependent CoA ligase [Telmatospirillum sp.]|uniref:DVU_1553 family AMP-dependent CoA ligase n=1 Tax=Telmatospirillum sp. TaxID=2079197 RepID=UPI00284EE293|nr:AMP-binding protein [Telmatospirillum sp.]MDR3439971.1 AMP-binding protein [Telmatospirillum sp.]